MTEVGQTSSAKRSGTLIIAPSMNEARMHGPKNEDEKCMDSERKKDDGQL
jgi:hypothetical protein